MSTRHVHLFSLRVADALRKTFEEGYKRRDFVRDLIAGATVGIMAIPLSMGFAIASGVAPEYGLYSAIIAGVWVAILGGSRFSVSGPSAAFIVVLNPVAQQYGIAGILLASLMAGGMLLLMAWGKLGRYIEYIPESVTLGLTAGIAIAVVALQIPDFIGLRLTDPPIQFIDKFVLIFSNLTEVDPVTLVVSAMTLVVMLVWPKFKLPIPPHFPALAIAVASSLVLQAFDLSVETIGSRFEYLDQDGLLNPGIPPHLPEFEWPWDRVSPIDGRAVFTVGMISNLLPAAFAIAMLGAIEALLCAVVLDGMSGKRHSANTELFALGVGNIVTPLFGGISATSEIARSTTNLRSGAASPIAAITQAAVVLIGLLFLSNLLAHVPMAALAAILIVTAWNMSQVPRCTILLKKAATSEVVVFATCLSLTVLVDMVIAVTIGVLMASLLFVREIASLTRVVDITDEVLAEGLEVPENWKVLRIKGVLFFAAAERIFEEILRSADGVEGIVIHMQENSYLDAGGIFAIERLVSSCKRKDIEIRFASWQFQPLRALVKARIEGERISPLEISFSTLREAIRDASNLEVAKRVNDLTL